ncbi:sugar ABC transporter substrate-binding protein [Christensenellaceae bacterium OttesenSCG-928-K19]|nr:sugar ABC transporter substrate-binding protein [Christensenellaceae bacterium OttesenSCG-928-K19]
MKYWKTIAIVLVLLLAVTLFGACSPGTTTEEPADNAATQEAAPEATEETPAETAATEETPAEGDAAESGGGGYDYHLGVIQPGPESYYQNYADSVKAAAEYAGMKVTSLLAEYSAETEIANVEDLISQGVDAIAVFSVASDTAQVDAQLCNEADIPLFLMSSTASEGTGVPTCTIGNSFYDMGKMDGDWVVENMEGEVKVLEIQGALGQGVAELHSEGFADAIAARDDIEVVYQQTANWVRADAIAITEDSLMSDLDFNMVFVHNEDMCAGVVSVLEENGEIGNINVVTMNGSNDGIQMIKDGKILATCANPPSYVGGDVVVQIMKFFDGADVPATFDSPTFMIDSGNASAPDLVTWDKEWAIARVDEYLASK